MVRELVWLENQSFAAWGCSACAWIMPNLRRTQSGKPSAPVRDAFANHDCAKSPRHPSTKENFRRVGAKSDFLGVINIAQISVSLMAQNEVFS